VILFLWQVLILQVVMQERDTTQLVSTACRVELPEVAFITVHMDLASHKVLRQVRITQPVMRELGITQLAAHST
jgi:Ran GTPase-activating protein (RanGAP) involved in mRNA processing and transport